MSSSPTPDPGGTPIPSVAISFATEIDTPDTGERDVTETTTRTMPFDGVVSKLYIDIPSGVRSYAGFNMRDAEREVKQFPFNEETDFAAFNGVSDFWPVSFPMRRGDDIEVNFINQNPNEDVSSNLLKVWVVFVGIEALPYTMEEIENRQGVSL